ncbi:MAG TPA: hypothetical protein VEV82_10030 [Actinomycetota bacterium]|nr:hypothetical protein [Actinomycetota bacterium]
MAEGKQKKVIQKLTVDAYLNAPGGKLRKAYAGEVKRLQKLGFRETNRKMGQREDHIRIAFEREVERYPGVPLPSVPPYII